MSVRTLLPIALLVAGSMGCSGKPQAEGTVAITVPTPVPVILPVAVGNITTSPTGAGVAAATLYTFSFTAPPSGGVGPYTVAWNFGDGGAAAGTTPSHLFANPGSFTVAATVTDSRGIAVQTSAPISIGSVTGRWTATFSGITLLPKAIDIVQAQAVVTATINGTADGFGAGTGSVANPRSLSVSVTFADALPAPYALTFVGNLNDTLLVWSGSVIGLDGCPCQFTATRPAASGLTAGFAPSSTRR